MIFRITLIFDGDIGVAVTLVPRGWDLKARLNGPFWSTVVSRTVWKINFAYYNTLVPKCSVYIVTRKTQLSLWPRLHASHVALSMEYILKSTATCARLKIQYNMFTHNKWRVIKVALVRTLKFIGQVKWPNIKNTLVSK